MVRNLAGLLITILVAAAYVADFYLNIEAAKKRVSVWRRGSTYWFIRSNGMAGAQRRARLIWVERLGYDENEAMLIAKYQSRLGLIGMTALVVVGGICAAVFEYLEL
ncbi:hypothetical protein AB7M17_008411 [Bradyrhizobium sp. USDA 377]